MANKKFADRVAEFKEQSDKQRDELAAIYGEILAGIGPAVEKARLAAENLSPSVRGVSELKQLLQIMNGGFVKVATEIITETETEAAALASGDAQAGDAP